VDKSKFVQFERSSAGSSGVFNRTPVIEKNDSTGERETIKTNLSK
jgi:hypothetical protein